MLRPRPRLAADDPRERLPVSGRARAEEAAEQAVEEAGEQVGHGIEHRARAAGSSRPPAVVVAVGGRTVVVGGRRRSGGRRRRHAVVGGTRSWAWCRAVGRGRGGSGRWRAGDDSTASVDRARAAGSRSTPWSRATRPHAAPSSRKANTDAQRSRERAPLAEVGDGRADERLAGARGPRSRRSVVNSTSSARPGSTCWKKLGVRPSPSGEVLRVAGGQRLEALAEVDGLAEEAPVPRVAGVVARAGGAPRAAGPARAPASRGGPGRRAPGRRSRACTSAS